MSDLPSIEDARRLLAHFDPGRFDASSDAWGLMDALYEHGFIVKGFDWMAWEEGRVNSENLSWIARLDFETLCKLFTAHARNDRFCENHWHAVGQQGVLAAMLWRLAELTNP